jgi:hypothetical protein
MKTLNRAMAITLITLITIPAALLHNNISDGLIYQYFYGWATFTMVSCEENPTLIKLFMLFLSFCFDGLNGL